MGSYTGVPLALEVLLTLMEDSDGDVRDWATFGVGALGDHQDTPAIREALGRRLADDDEDAREEAIVGLARRQDTRVLPSLFLALQQPEISVRIIESAYTMLGMDIDREEWSGQDYINALRERFGVGDL